MGPGMDIGLAVDPDPGLHELVGVVFGGVPTQADADRGRRLFRAGPHGGEHAAPALSARPARSNWMTWVSASTPGMVRQLVLASRGAPKP